MQKKTSLWKTAAFPLGLIILMLMQTGCTTYEIESLWREKELTIDGSSSDWLGTLTYIEDPGISVGLQNDADYLFVCLVTEEYSPYMQTMRRGFTLWFDSKGGKNKTLGIRFSRQLPPPQNRENPGFNPAAEPPKNRAKSQAPRIDILTSKDDAGTRLNLEKIAGIEAKQHISSGLLVYEFKIPLTRSEGCPYAIGASPGGILGIGFESEKIDREKLRAAAEASGMRGGQPGGMGGRAGMGGRSAGGRGRPGAISGQALKIWITAELAVQLSPSF